MARVEVNVAQAKPRLSELIAAAERGDDVVIARAGRPAVRLVAVPAATRGVDFAIWRGRVHIADDFDAPLPGVEEDLYEGPIEPA